MNIFLSLLTKILFQTPCVCTLSPDDMEFFLFRDSLLGSSLEGEGWSEAPPTSVQSSESILTAVFFLLFLFQMPLRPMTAPRPTLADFCCIFVPPPSDATPLVAELGKKADVLFVRGGLFPPYRAGIVPASIFLPASTFPGSFFALDRFLNGLITDLSPCFLCFPDIVSPLSIVRWLGLPSDELSISRLGCEGLIMAGPWWKGEGEQEWLDDWLRELVSLSVGVPGRRPTVFGTGMETWPCPLLMGGGGLGLFSMPICKYVYGTT